MNEIATMRTRLGERTYLDILVDGRPLKEYLRGRLGANPSQVPLLGWSSASPAYRAKVVAILLGEGEVPRGEDVPELCSGA